MHWARDPRATWRVAAELHRVVAPATRYEPWSAFQRLPGSQARLLQLYESLRILFLVLPGILLRLGSVLLGLKRLLLELPLSPSLLDLGVKGIVLRHLQSILGPF